MASHLSCRQLKAHGDKPSALLVEKVLRAQCLRRGPVVQSHQLLGSASCVWRLVKPGGRAQEPRHKAVRFLLGWQVRELRARVVDAADAAVGQTLAH